MITIDDVAKKAGVSKSSVSRVINCNYDYMRDETRIKIVNAINELKYTPNSVAQSLKKKQTKLIGIVLSDISNPFFAEVLKGAEDESRRKGFGLMVNGFGEDPQIEKENIILLKNRQVDGLIVNTTGFNEDVFKNLQKEKFPFVFLDSVNRDIQSDTVIINNNLGAKKAVNFLIEQGHKNIGLLSYKLNKKSIRIDRLNSYKRTLLENGIKVEPSLIKICEQKVGAGIKATIDLLTSNNRPTAIFSINPRLNIEVLSGIKQIGLRVPRDISLIGYDDYPWTPLFDPPLTTVAQPAYELGKEATSLLISAINSKEQKRKTKTIVLEPELIERKSTSQIL